MPLVGGRLLLASFFFYFMIGLRFREAARANLIVFAALVVAFLAGTMPTATATYLMALLFTANIIGFAGSYALEHANRTAFLEHRQLTEVATHDGLTTLLNRAAFEDQIRRVWQQAQRDRQTVAVIMIDLDYFKAYNDRYGHIAGDDCLRRVSSALRDAARRRPLDFVARYGGEELVAVLYGADKAYGESIARSLLTAVRELRIPHAEFRDAALRHRERGRGVGGCVPHRHARRRGGARRPGAVRRQTPGPRSLRRHGTRRQQDRSGRNHRAAAARAAVARSSAG